MIIAIGHESGVGKDTFCAFLIDYIRQQNMKGLNLVREGFADRVYELAYSLYSWAGFQSREYYLRNRNAKTAVLPLLGKTPVEVLIGLAEKLREWDADCWLNANIKNKGAHLKLINDLRKPNEFRFCEEHGIFRLRIRVPGKPRSTLFSDVHLYDYPDERWSETIDNDGTIAEFNEKVKEFGKRVVIPQLMKYRSGECKPQSYTSK
jgi:hypothetical protein